MRPAPALACLLLFSCATSPTPRATPGDARAYRALVELLAADEMEGRGIATEGNRKAAAVLADEFARSGLMPGGDGGFAQCFEHPSTTRVVALSLTVGTGEVEELGTSAFSGSGSFDGDLWFAGYGIHAPDEGYDDFAQFDPNDKVLLLLRFEPWERDPQSKLNGDRPSRHSELRRKVFEARSRGAKAVVFVAPPAADGKVDDRVPGLGEAAESDAGLPVLHVLPAVVDGWLQAKGTSLAQQVAAIDADGKSTAIPLGRASGEVKLSRELQELCNVVGVLPGEGSLADESVVIGAHFDHLGYGQPGSMEPGVRAIHNGADDNASGTAGIVMLARRLGRLEGPRRAFVFIAFNGEEVGLAGSSRYVAAPTRPLDRTNLMINLDMIGRLRNGRAVVLGTGSGEELAGWLDQAAAATGLHLEHHGDGYGPSDQTAFYSKGVPVLHFFTGAHADYHRPSDDADTLNYQGAGQVLDAVEFIARMAATTRSRVTYAETSSGPSMAGDSRGHGAWLGTVPDYTAMSPGAAGGVLLSGVRGAGPAQMAGIRKGDIIVAMAGREIQNIYDMTFVLRDHRPGDVVQVIVERGGERQELAATLGSRARMGAGRTAHGKSGDPPHSPHAAPSGPPMDPDTLLYPGEEKFLKNLRQLTFEGENAEAYFGPTGKTLVYQARGEGVLCDRIYTLDIETRKRTAVSSGEGRATCGYFTWPKGEDIVYASTHLAGKSCPPEPDRSMGYVWPIYPEYDLFLKHGEKTRRLTRRAGYDAEATVCFENGRVVFTSTRDVDLELYLMDLARPEEAWRITSVPGYDGGAFFSPDCSKLVWRASRPQGEALKEYWALLANNLVRPSKMEIFIADGDGENARQVTHNGAANFAPYFLPDNERIIFASNANDPKGRNFDLYLLDPRVKDAQPERVTFSPVFEAFPMFSPDGKFLVFASNRNARKEGDTNLFIAQWVQ